MFLLDIFLTSSSCTLAKCLLAALKADLQTSISWYSDPSLHRFRALPALRLALYIGLGGPPGVGLGSTFPRYGNSLSQMLSGYGRKLIHNIVLHGGCGVQCHVPYSMHPALWVMLARTGTPLAEAHLAYSSCLSSSSLLRRSPNFHRSWVCLLQRAGLVAASHFQTISLWSECRWPMHLHCEGQSGPFALGQLPLGNSHTRGCQAQCQCPLRQPWL